MKIADIGELAGRTGVAISTLRYYDEIGLLPLIGRRGLRRQFGPDAELQVALVSLCKKAGFSLTEVTAFLADGDCRDLPRDAVRERADQIDRQIRELGTMRDLLVYVANCPARTHLGCPKFRKMLKVGGLGPYTWTIERATYGLARRISNSTPDFHARRDILSHLRGA